MKSKSKPLLPRSVGRFHHEKCLECSLSEWEGEGGNTAPCPLPPYSILSKCPLLPILDREELQPSLPPLHCCKQTFIKYLCKKQMTREILSLYLPSGSASTHQWILQQVSLNAGAWGMGGREGKELTGC